MKEKIKKIALLIVSQAEIDKPMPRYRRLKIIKGVIKIINQTTII